MTASPHGTARRAREGCDCQPCARALDHALRAKRRQLDIALGRDRRTRTAPEDRCAAAHQRLQDLVEANPHLGVNALARITGVSRPTLSAMLRSPGRPLSPATVDAVLAVQVATSVDPSPSRVPVDELARLSGSLMALGYPISWQSARIGHHLRRSLDYPRVSTTVVVALRRLSEQVGDAAASPADGLSTAIITRTRRLAASRGFYPPICYDDDGNLVPEAMPDHPWARADRFATRRMTIADLLLKGMSLSQVARELGISERGPLDVSKALRDTWGAWRYDATACSRITALIDEWRAGECSSAWAALRLRIALPDSLPTDLPDLLAWQQHTPEGLAWVAARAAEHEARLAAEAALLVPAARNDDELAA